MAKGQKATSAPGTPTSVSAFYDSLLRSALRQFFDRATLDTESTPSISSDGRLAIEPSANPAALIIRWFGIRYTLRVPPQWPFTAHEVRLAQAIGTVLAARYRAILSQRILEDRGDHFRGAIEDRYVGAFLDRKPYTFDADDSRADRIAAIIELLRVGALSSYENRPISTGVLLLSTLDDPFRPGVRGRSAVSASAESLTSIKSFYRLADGTRTVFLASTDGRLLDIIDIDRWASRQPRELQVPCATPYQAHARATLHHEHVCVVLTETREIKVFAEGAQVFAFRGAAWHLLDIQAKYRRWAAAVGNEGLALRIFQTALDLADAREGALFVVAADPSSRMLQMVAPADRLDIPLSAPIAQPGAPSRRDLLHLLEQRSLIDLAPSVLAAVASLDGATVVDMQGRLLAVGAILRHPPLEQQEPTGSVEGARTFAALAASRFGPVLKVSEDGVITFFEGGRVWDL